MLSARARLRAAGSGLLLALALLGVRLARAHDPFEITTDAHVSGADLAVHTTLSLLTAARACLAGADAQKQLLPADFESERAHFEACARDYYLIRSGGEPLPLRSSQVSLGREADVEMKLVYARPTRSPLVFDAQGLRRLVARAGVVITVTGARTFLGQKVLRPDDSVFEIPITDAGEAPGTAPSPSFGRFLLLGIEHIASGVDHLLFLLGLLVVCRRVRSVAAIVTCFTLAHSITLALAALQQITLPSRIVEPLIAATIVLVGVENLKRPTEPEGPWVARWLVAFAFGLIHGLGFASALQEIGLGSHGSSVLGPLVAFNLGVEIGQLSVAALLLAIVWSLPRTGPLRRFPQLASLGIAAIGLFWFVQRIAS
jgi:hydrogenase/urease accessory protein HupE